MGNHMTSAPTGGQGSLVTAAPAWARELDDATVEGHPANVTVYVDYDEVVTAGSRNLRYVVARIRAEAVFPLVSVPRLAYGQKLSIAGSGWKARCKVRHEFKGAFAHTYFLTVGDTVSGSLGYPTSMRLELGTGEG